MTKKFDTLIESLISEMMPATLLDTMGGTAERISKKVQELPGKSQHWGPLQKLSFETREEIVKAIIQNVFQDNDDNTYSMAIDNETQLKEAIKDAIKEVATKNPEFKATSKWAIQFLADRLSNKDLLGNVRFTTEAGKDIVQDKDVTHAEVKAALNKALEGPKKEEDEDEDGETEEDEYVAPEEKPAAYFSPSKEYYLKIEDEIRGGTFAKDPEVKAIYDKLSAMYGEVASGRDFEKYASRFDLGSKDLTKLIDAGVMDYSEEQLEKGEAAGFEETEEDYIERITRGAREDLKKSSLGDDFGVDFG